MQSTLDTTYPEIGYKPHDSLSLIAFINMPSIIEYLSFHFCNPGRSILLIVDGKASRPGKLDWGGFYVPTTSRMADVAGYGNIGSFVDLSLSQVRAYHSSL